MKKLILIIFLLGVNQVFAQKYNVQFDTEYRYISSNFFEVSVEYRLLSNTETIIINGKGETTISGIPREIIIRSILLDIDEYGQIVQECRSYEQSIYLDFNECNEYTNSSFGTTCSGFVALSINISPILSYDEELIAPPQSIFCSSEPIRLVASPGFSSYNWKMRLEDGDFISFNPGTGNDVSFTLEEEVGTDLNAYLNKNVFFAYTVGNCTDINVASIVDYKFSLPTPAILSYSTSSPKCPDGNDGGITSITLDRNLITGESIQYDLMNSLNIPMVPTAPGEFTGLEAGNYTLSLQPLNDMTYCDGVIPKNITLLDPEPIEMDTTSLIPISCINSSDASITIIPSGGTGSNYRFQVEGQSETSNPVLQNLSMGDHTLWIRDENDCIQEFSLNIPGPSEALNLNHQLTSDFNGFPISCSSAADATAQLISSGGWGYYTYSDSVNGNFTAINTFSGLSSGEHTFWVKDNRGCIAQTTINIQAPDPITLITSIQPPSCPGLSGVVEVTGTGGAGQLEFSIDNSNYQFSSQFNLQAGTYNVYSRDRNGCLTSIPIEITEPDPITFTAVIEDISCESSNDGEILVNSISNGTPPYEMSVDGGSIFTSDLHLTQLSSGSYNVIVRDQNNCTGSAFLTINKPPQINGTISESPISCYEDSNGSLEVQATGGAGGYTYLWSTGDTGTVISNLSAGEYSVQIYDANGCVSNSLYYSLSNPNELHVIPLVTLVNGYAVSCSGGSDGSAEVIVSGGTIQSDYTYLWSNNQSDRVLSNVSSGEYTVFVEDDNGCETGASLEITEPAPIEIIDLGITDILCYDGTNGRVSVEVAGGVGNYQYSLNSGTFQSSSTFSDLNSGEYQLLIQDKNACSILKNFELKNPEELLIQITERTNTTCNNTNGSITINARGGTGDLEFKWLNEKGEIIGTNNQISELLGGAYSIIVEDGNGCTKQENITISDSDGPAISTGEIVGISCSNKSDGMAEVVVSGGTPPYVVKWEGGQSGLTVTDLSAGVYEVSVIDSSGCINYISVEVPDKENIEVTEIDLKVPSCFDANDGAVNVGVSGGSPPYQLKWQDGTVGASHTNLGAGYYLLTITDANNCSFDHLVTVPQPEILEIKSVEIDPTCDLVANGRLELAISGGTPPYELYFQDSLVNTNIITDLGSGTYEIQVKDANGCSSETTINLQAPNTQTIPLDDLTICIGQTVELTSPIIGKSYQWYKASELLGWASSFQLNSEGTYTLVVTTDDGCTSQGEFFVSTSSEVLNTEFLMSTTVQVGDTVILIDITHPIPDSVAWNFPANTEILDTTSDYALVVFDEPGIFSIGMEAYLGDCYEQVISSIEVVEVISDSPGGRFINQNIPMILSLELYPNPNDGEFTISTELNISHSIEVKIIHLISNQIVFELSEDQRIEHELNFSLKSLSSGPYAIVVSAGEEQRVLRMLKN